MVVLYGHPLWYNVNCTMLGPESNWVELLMRNLDSLNSPKAPQFAYIPAACTCILFTYYNYVLTSDYYVHPHPTNILQWLNQLRKFSFSQNIWNLMRWCNVTSSYWWHDRYTLYDAMLASPTISRLIKSIISSFIFKLLKKLITQ